MKTDATEETKSSKKEVVAELSEGDVLRALQQKIRVGLNSEAHIDPRDRNALACRACYQRGWAAALKWLLQD